MRRQRFGDRDGVFGMPLHPQLHRLESAQCEPAVERAGHAAQRVLEKPDGLEDALVARDDGALHQVGVPRQVFGHTVHDQIGAELERLLEIGRRKCIVHDDQRAAGVRDAADRVDVVHEQPRIRRRLEPDDRRLRRDRTLERGEIAEVNGLDPASDRLEDAVQHAKRAAVHVARHDDLPARLEIRLKNGVFGREPGAEDRRMGGAFELGEHRLEPFARRVRCPRVVKSAMLPRPDLLIRRRLKNRRDDRAGLRLGRLARVNRLRCEIHRVLLEKRPRL